jgi:hypothetical protein
MTLRQYAAIHLCVPDSGEGWLDDMIRKAQRDRLAGQALTLFYWQRPEPKDGESGQDSIARMTYSVADAMLAERDKPTAQPAEPNADGMKRRGELLARCAGAIRAHDGDTALVSEVRAELGYA